MRPFLALGLILLGAPSYAQKSADEHFDGIKKEVPPAFSQQLYIKQGEKYMKDYQGEVRQSEAKRNDLIKAFFDAFPNDERLPDLLVQRWVSMFNSGTSSAQVGKDIDDSLKKTKSTEVQAAGMFSRLAVNILDPKSKMDVVKGINEFRDRFKSHKRYKELMQLAAMQTSGETRRQVIGLFAKDFPDSDFSTLYQGQLHQSEAIGKPFSLKFEDVVTGKAMDTKDLLGKVVIVQWWATTSPQSRQSMRELKELYRVYHDSGLEVVGVNLDDKDSKDLVKDFVRENHMPWPQNYLGKGEKSDLAQQWGIMALPTHFLIDKKGHLSQIEPEDLEDAVKKLLKD